MPGKMLTIRRLAAAAGVAAAISVVPAIPAFAGTTGGSAGGGLVNVTVTDILNNNQTSVQLPLDVAANVCGVNVNVLSTQLADNGNAKCTATGGLQTLFITPIN